MKCKTVTKISIGNVNLLMVTKIIYIIEIPEIPLYSLMPSRSIKCMAQKKTHEEFLEYSAKYMLQEAVQTTACVHSILRPNTSKNGTEKRMVDKNFSKHITPFPGAKHLQPSKLCYACYFTRKSMAELGYHEEKLPRKLTSFWCTYCKETLCIEPCLKVYHISVDYISVLPQNVYVGNRSKYII